MEIIYLIGGLVLGSAIVLIIFYLQKRSTGDIAAKLVKEAQTEKLQDLDNFLQRIKESFDSVSMEALNKSLAQHLEIAKSALSEQSAIGAKDLEGKKELVSQTFTSIRDELDKVGKLIGEFEKERQQKYGELAGLLANTGDRLNLLHETTAKLTTALVRSHARGNWGERMAEDVLKLAGFIDGINYYRQKALQSSAQRPDFTFLLPNGQKINMDVKFPFNNYWTYLESENPDDKERHKKLFLRDVKNRIKEITTRDYINPDDNTVEMVIMFIPNEQVYSFINESDRTILDEAIRNRVAICSPLTLFAILAIIRQALDNFNLERTANEILALMGNFKKQWELFSQSLENLGKRLDAAGKEYGSLITTRSNQLQKPLDKIEYLRSQKNIPIAADNLDEQSGYLPDNSDDEMSPPGDDDK